MPFCPCTACCDPLRVRDKGEQEQEEQQEQEQEEQKRARYVIAGLLLLCFSVYSSTVYSITVFSLFDSIWNIIIIIIMSTPFQDLLREKEHTGPPLVVSREWPPPEGTDFVEVEAGEKEIGVATVHHGRLLVLNDEVSRALFATRFSNSI